MVGWLGKVWIGSLLQELGLVAEGMDEIGSLERLVIQPLEFAERNGIE